LEVFVEDEEDWVINVEISSLAMYPLQDLHLGRSSYASDQPLRGDSTRQLEVEEIRKILVDGSTMVEGVLEIPLARFEFQSH
jgi:hypothetical protein